MLYKRIILLIIHQLISKNIQNYRANVQKIMSLDARLDQWKERRKKLIIDNLGMSVVGYICILSMYFGLTYFSGKPFGMSEVLSSLLFTIIIMIPVVVYFHSNFNKKPTQADVDKDVELRRLYGMDDTVNED
jgi:amino acid transporter